MRSSDIVIIGIIIGLFGLIAFLLIKQMRDKARQLKGRRELRRRQLRGTGSGNLLPHTGAYSL